MSIFKNVLKSDESLFLNEMALDYSYIPKLLPYRESQQKHIANCIKPMLNGKTGKNLFIFGAPGIGKTAAIKHIFRDLEDETDECIPLYINCWQKNTTFKILLEICDLLGYKFTQNKKTEELFKVVHQILNKKSVVFALDEVDKLEDLDFIYSALEDIYKKSIFLITNYKDWIEDLDERIKSRLLPEMLMFKPYSPDETKGILRQRMGYAFVPNVWDEDAFDLVAQKASEVEDIRSGLYLMKEAGVNAENRASRKITIEDAKIAIKKLDDFKTKQSSDLTDDENFVLNLVKNHSDAKIGDLYNIYKEKGGASVYKTFQRKIKKLESNKFINVKKTEGGSEGNTSIVSYKKDTTKKLSEF